MQKSDIRTVSSIADFSRAAKAGEAVHFPRPKAIGDFKALARWLEEKAQPDESGLKQDFSLAELRRLADKMPAAELFAARQVIADCEAFEKLGEKVALVAADEGIADSVVCYYTRPVGGQTLTDLWRTEEPVSPPENERRQQGDTWRLMLRVG